ncbi:MAG: Cna B-type domain-containing protein, partial [Clostridiales bacterium]|nr:Cna B-type domain-containing protein [Clostridiales bacterium]
VTGYEPEITVGEDGSFTICYKDLPKNADGEPITYTVKEDPVEGYEAKDGKTTAENGGKLVNVHEPEVTDVTVTKKWEDADDQDKIRPDAEAFASHIHLMNGEVEVTGYEPEITVGEDGSFTICYKDLPKNADGEPITYTVKEDPVEGYEAKDGKTTAEDGGVIVNIHEPEPDDDDTVTPDDDTVTPDDDDKVTPDDDKVTPKDSGKTTSQKTRTGDPAAMTPYLLAALIAFVTIAFLLVTGRKKRDEK